MPRMVFVNIPVTDVARSLADPAKSTAVMIALSQDSRADVNKITEAALKAGGTEPKPAQDMGFVQPHVPRPRWQCA